MPPLSSRSTDAECSWTWHCATSSDDCHTARPLQRAEESRLGRVAVGYSALGHRCAKQTLLSAPLIDEYDMVFEVGIAGRLLDSKSIHSDFEYKTISVQIVKVP